MAAMKYPAQKSNTVATGIESIARFISDAANPLVITPLVFLMVGWQFSATYKELFCIVSLALVFYSIIPLSFIFYLKSSGQIDNLDIRDKSKRSKPYFLTIGSYLAGSLFISSFSVSWNSDIWMIATCFFINPLIGYLINRRWKVSIHSAALGTAISVLYVMMHSLQYSRDPILGYVSFLFLLILLPFVMWSRYRLDVHSVPQVLGGALIGLLLTYGELMLMMNL